MSRKNNPEAEVMLDENGNIIEEYYPDHQSGDLNRTADDMLSESEAKKEVQRLNRHFVNEFKSTIRTVIIALNRSVTLDEIKEAVEYFEDTSVDVKLIKRAIRALIKEEKLSEVSKNVYELSQKKREFYASLKALKENPTHR